MKRVFLSITFLILLHFCYSQEKHTVSGIIKEKNSGEILIGASAYLLELPKSVTISNAYGFYSITAPAGKYTLIVNFSGFKQDTSKISLDKNLSLPIQLKNIGNQLKEVVVNSKKRNENVAKPIMGTQKLSINEIKNIPVQ